MLFRNGENLKTELINYLSNKNKITIFCPFIKAKTLSEILNAPNLKCEQIIVRWEPRDIAMGSSDIEIYDLCKEHNISLFMNNKIHLKLFTNNFEDAFLGSANLSERAITDKEGNYEINTLVNKIDRHDRIYLQNIINESTLVTDDIYEFIKNNIPIVNDNIKLKSFDIPKKLTEKDNFLISKLPMIESPELLWELYINEKQTLTEEEENCLIHDLVLYRIKPGIKVKNDFLNIIRESFFSSPFIKAFLDAVDESSQATYKGRKKEGLQFGAVRKWFAKNTSTAPTPKAFELTNNVQILYTWIENLSEGTYSVFIPGSYSQVIIKNK